VLENADTTRPRFDADWLIDMDELGLLRIPVGFMIILGSVAVLFLTI
jgi:hypothetical protein